MIQKICNATNERLPGKRNTEGNLRGFTVVKSAHVLSVSLCLFLSGESGKI